MIYKPNLMRSSQVKHLIIVLTCLAVIIGCVEEVDFQAETFESVIIIDAKDFNCLALSLSVSHRPGSQTDDVWVGVSFIYDSDIASVVQARRKINLIIFKH